MVVHAHVIKTEYHLLPIFVQLFIPPCLINAVQRDEINMAKPIGYYQLEMIVPIQNTLITLCNKQVQLSETRLNNVRNVANYSL